jgi:two-component system, OmpR family, sensor histidine kinase VanS
VRPVDPRPSTPQPGLTVSRLSLTRLAPGRILHLPPPTVRLRLTLLYSGLFLVSGVALLGTTYLLFRSSTGVDLILPTETRGGLHGISQNPEVLHQLSQRYVESLERHRHGLHEGLIQSGIALAILTVVSVALGWLVAGRVLRPLRTITATTRQISEHNLNQRLALSGPSDELKDLADTVDGLLARLEAHVAGQQRFAANASHELRTPLAITQTLLEVARKDANGANDDLVDRLYEVNTRAIDLTEALLLLSRTGQHAFATERLDLSLIVEEATETLLAIAEQRGITIEISGETTPTIGSHLLLLQMTTNLVQNAIVHNLPGDGAVWVTTQLDADSVELTVESTGEQLAPNLVSTLTEPFQRGSERTRSHHEGVGLGLAIVKSITEAHDGTLVLAPRATGGLRVTVRLPAAARSLAADD